MKQTLDLTAAATGLVLLLPLLGAVAIAIKVDGGGPVLFTQKRVGHRGKVFRMVKFRTMVVGEADEGGSGIIEKHPDDARVTRVGSALRRFSLDELPQLGNVLRGQMSLVGPRPLPLCEAATLSGWQDGRHDMRPGMTGLWQVLGRSDIAFEERMRLDWLYVRYWSPGWDARILARTVRSVVTGRGAY